MNSFDQNWRRLTAAARLAPARGEEAAPYGFATRVAAQAMAQARPSFATLLERFSWRAIGVAGLVALLSLAVSYSKPASAASNTTEDDLGTADGVAQVLDLS